MKNRVYLFLTIATVSAQLATASDCKSVYEKTKSDSLRVALIDGLSAGKTNPELDQLVLDILKNYYAQVYGKAIVHSENKNITKKPIADDDTSKNIQVRHIFEYDQIVDVLTLGMKGEFCKKGAMNRKEVIAAVVPNLKLSIDVR